MDGVDDGQTLAMPAVSRNVLAIPAGHRYVERIRPDGWHHLPDPTDPWWPHPGLDPDHLLRIRHQVDLVHLHFGFEHRSTAELLTWLDLLDRLDLPLVFTVHDLRNPHLTDNDRHVRHLDALLARASVVLTLTPCAATLIERRWRRTAEVIAHPPLFEAGPVPVTEAGSVGITFKDRPSTAGLDVLAPICAATRRRDGRVHARFEPSVASDTLEEARRLVDGAGDVTVDEPMSDGAFSDHLARLQVAVLPYRFGTHSGWLEACRDLGTRVIAPRVGCYQGQWDEVLHYEPGPNQSASLGRAVEGSLAMGPIPAPPASEQAERLTAVRTAHDEAYRSALAGGRP